MKFKWLYRTAWLLTAVTAVLLAYAPYLPRLLWEGYPAAKWPAPGAYATVAGSKGEALPAAPRLAHPDEQLADLFGSTEGRALLASRDGKIVMEHYAPGIGRETRLNSYSLAKSLVGALALKAISEGRISGREAALRSLLPELSATNAGDLPLCRLLDMRSGIFFEAGPKKEASGPDLKDLEATKLNLFGPMARLHMLGPKSIETQLVRQDADATEADACAGGSYSYQNLNTAIVGEVLERAYGKPLQELLSEKIWAPSGAEPAEWRRYSSDLPVTPYCCIYARPMDWLLVAQFLLDNGKLGTPFLPSSLWSELMGLSVPDATLHAGSYSNFIYHNVLDKPGATIQGPFAYFFGSRGQAVYFMPKERLAVVRFGGKVQLLHSTLYGVARSIADIPDGPTTIGQR